ncbi:MAG: ankyrin repeat domain-containing protein [Armatimonadetes bacterium]|nr:ankyrin repeat domain-containing protein [Armatimonadota bacterium]
MSSRSALAGAAGYALAGGIALRLGWLFFGSGPLDRTPEALFLTNYLVFFGLSGFVGGAVGGYIAGGRGWALRSAIALCAGSALGACLSALLMLGSMMGPGLMVAFGIGWSLAGAMVGWAVRGPEGAKKGAIGFGVGGVAGFLPYLLNPHIDTIPAMTVYAAILGGGLGGWLLSGHGSPLALAAARGDRDTVQSLLGSGSDINARDWRGRTALIRAAESGHPAILNLLLDSGAESDLRDGRGQTALILASRYGPTGSVRLLLARHADPEVADRIFRRTPLIWAAMLGHTDIVEALLARGANLQARDRQGKTAHAWAASRGQNAIARLLERAMAGKQSR